MPGGRIAASTSCIWAKASFGTICTIGTSGDIDGAEERAAENEIPAIDNPAQLAERLELSIPELRWLAYHREAAQHIHYQRFTIAKRDGSDSRDLGAAAETENCSTLDLAEYCRTFAVPWRSPRFLTRSVDSVQRVPAHQRQDCAENGSSGLLPNDHIPACERNVFAKRAIENKSPRCWRCCPPSHRAKPFSMPARPSTSPWDHVACRKAHQPVRRSPT